MRKTWIGVILMLCHLWIPCTLGAEDDESITLRKLTLSPMPEAREALKYRLLIPVSQLKNANAALLYQNAVAHCPQDGDNKLFDKIDQWREMPIDQLPQDEVDKALEAFRASFRCVGLAAFRSRCEWDMPMEEGFAMLIPSLSTYRKIAKALAVKVRLDMAKGRIDEVLNTLTAGLAMGRGVADGPTLIQDLVGISISATMFKQIGEFVAMPGAPNLYWALTELPVPWIDLRQSMSHEFDLMYWEIPELRDLDKEILSEAQATALVSTTFKKFTEAGLWDHTEFSVLPLAWVMMHYVDAKTFLAEWGMDASRIEAMPAAQAVMLYQFLEFKDVRDDMFKWLTLPYAQYRERSKEYDKALDRVMNRGFKSNLFAMYLPALSRVRFLGVRLCRDIDLLRTIEALRLHAAANQGRFPNTLNDVTVVPIPNDPVTGDPFVYDSTDARHVRLEAPEAEEQTHKRPVFELALRP